MLTRERSPKQEKERAIDLIAASRYSEEICNELVTIGSNVETPGLILQSCDRNTVPFLDILIGCELKQVMTATNGNTNYSAEVRMKPITKVIITGETFRNALYAF